MTTHGHEEVDTMIPLHVVDIVRESKLRTIDVWSPYTDLRVLLIDLAANDHLRGINYTSSLDWEVSEIQSNRCTRSCGGMGPEKSRGLIGLHHFKDAE